MKNHSMVTKEGEKNRNTLLEAYPDETLKFAIGFDDAIIGIHDNFTPKPRIIYSKRKCIKVLMSGGMSFEEALEYFEFNVSGAYVGEDTPIWCDDLMFEDL